MDMDFGLGNNDNTGTKSKKAAFKKNIVPVTLKMIQKISMNDNQRLLDNFQIQRVVLIVRVLGQNLLAGRINLNVTDDTAIGRIVIIISAGEERLSFIQNTEHYKFTCYIKQDHQEIVLYSLNCQQVQNYNEISNHQTHVINAHIQRLYKEELQENE